MAEKSLSLDELVGKLLGDEHADVLRETLAWFVGELMEAEVAGQIGAGLHEKTPGRTTHRNGCRERVCRRAPARLPSPSRDCAAAAPSPASSSPAPAPSRRSSPSSRRPT